MGQPLSRWSPAGGLCPRDPLTQRVWLWAFRCSAGFAVVGVGASKVYCSLLGCESSGRLCSSVPPIPPAAAALGGAQHIREVDSATVLRLVAPPKVTAAHRLLSSAIPILCPAVVPVLFREPMGGESGDGGYREAGMRYGSEIRWGGRLTWLRGHFPPDPRQKGMPPLEPPFVLAR